MGAIASHTTGVSIVYSMVCSCVAQIKHQSSASLDFVRGIHRWPVDFPHKWPLTWKMLPFDDIIMVSSTAPGERGNNSKYLIFGHIVETFRWMPQNTFDDKSTLFQVMTWWRQATKNYLSQCCANSVSPYDVPRPQCVARNVQSLSLGVVSIQGYRLTSIEPPIIKTRLSHGRLNVKMEIPTPRKAVFI